MEVFECSGPGPAAHTGGEGSEGINEHGSGGEGGDESSTDVSEEGRGGNALAQDETFDSVSNGARLILNYDGASNSFKGTVGNTTDGVLNRVRVEVHLSNGAGARSNDSDEHGARRSVRDQPARDAGILHWMDSTCRGWQRR